jgi:hypothetical protein
VVTAHDPYARCVLPLAILAAGNSFGRLGPPPVKDLHGHAICTDFGLETIALLPHSQPLLKCMALGLVCGPQRGLRKQHSDQHCQRPALPAWPAAFEQEAHEVCQGVPSVSLSCDAAGGPIDLATVSQQCQQVQHRHSDICSASTDALHYAWGIAVPNHSKHS